MPLRFNETVTDIGQKSPKEIRDRILKSKIYGVKFDKHVPENASEKDIKAFEKDLRRNPGKYPLHPIERELIYDKVDKYKPLDRLHETTDSEQMRKMTKEGSIDDKPYTEKEIKERSKSFSKDYEDTIEKLKNNTYADFDKDKKPIQEAYNNKLTKYKEQADENSKGWMKRFTKGSSMEDKVAREVYPMDKHLNTSSYDKSIILGQQAREGKYNRDRSGNENGRFLNQYGELEAQTNTASKEGLFTTTYDAIRQKKEDNDTKDDLWEAHKEDYSFLEEGADKDNDLEKKIRQGFHESYKDNPNL